MTVDEALQRARAIQQPPYTVLELAAMVLADAFEQQRADLIVLRALLRELEWNCRPWAPAKCPFCWGDKPEHAPDCRLAVALKTDAEG